MEQGSLGNLQRSALQRAKQGKDDDGPKSQQTQDRYKHNTKGVFMCQGYSEVPISPVEE